MPNRLRHTDDQQHHARRDEDEGSPPDGQADTDRDQATDEPAPRDVHAINIDPQLPRAEGVHALA